MDGEERLQSSRMARTIHVTPIGLTTTRSIGPLPAGTTSTSPNRVDTGARLVISSGTGQCNSVAGRNRGRLALLHRSFDSARPTPARRSDCGPVWLAEQPLGHHDALDLVGALVDLGVLPEVSGAAQNPAITVVFVR